MEQFPEFASTTKEMLVEYKETLDKGMKTNKEGVQTYYDSCNSVIASLQKQLEEENLSFKDRKYVIDKMLEVSKVMGEKDSENKKFIATLAVVGAIATCVASAVLASALGGNTQIETNDNNLI